MKKLLLVPLALAVLAGCGQKVEVPPGSVGKIMTKDGWREGVITTSKFRLDPCFSYCDKLILLNVADHTIVETDEVFMPKDKLVLKYSTQAAISVNPNKYEVLFNKVTPQDGEISLDRAYQVYAKELIRSEARGLLTEYKISEVASSRAVVETKLANELATRIEAETPFLVRNIYLSEVQYPAIITKAQERAAERREAIAQENAQLEIARVQYKRELEEETLRRKVEVEKAEAEAEVSRILGGLVTPKYVKYRELNALDSIATSANTTFVPVSMLDSVAMQTMVGK